MTKVMNAIELSKLPGYELVSSEELKDLQSLGFIFKHKKTGARVVVISNDDNNKVFSIGFKTPPTDSTGVPHIIEHSVLCGSKRFPAKDPFIELAKGSLNTFLNAMTYPDKTIYPVASCNDKDFQNLMHVYLDAVLYPNIYQREEIFMQEGWHYELEDKDSPLIYNGVVYNEMKGAFSSPESILFRLNSRSLYPDTSYATESGGDPDYITDLTYQDFLDFHKKFYHPSNSYIYLYGDMNVEEKLNFIDNEYLNHFDYLDVDAVIQEQKPFDQLRVEEQSFPLSENENVAENTYLSYNVSIGKSTDKELVLAFQILETVLLSAPGAPLKQALIDAGIGKDILGYFENDINQPYFTVIAKNSEEEKKEQFLQVIRSTLENLVKNGIDEKSLKAAINIFEFRYREADFGQFPKGLMYGLQVLGTWLYDDTQVFNSLYANDVIATLKAKLGTGYFEELIRKYLLDNTHASVVVLKPEVGLTKKKDEALKEKLATYKASLSEEELNKIIEATKHLKQYQEEPSTKEELESIPLLNREDISKDAAPIVNAERNIDGVKLLHHNVYTNGIIYLKLLFRLNQVPKELTSYVGLLNTALGYINTKKHGFMEFSNEVNMNTGGMSSGVTTFGKKGDNSHYEPALIVDTKVLYDKLGNAFELIKEMIHESIFDDPKRLLEIILELKSRLQMRITSQGHSAAIDRAFSYYSEEAYFSEQVKGIAYFKFIEDLAANFEQKKEEIISNLQMLVKYIFRKENLLVSATVDEAGIELVADKVKDFSDTLYTDEITGSDYKFTIKKLNEGFKTSSQVQYVANVGNFYKAGFQYTGALKVLKTIMGYDYLWNNVRVKGGAYGCMCNFSGIDGNSYFVSYRDPNLKATKEVYERAYDYIKNFAADEREMTKYIIGTMSNIDVPLTPSGKGSRSLNCYMTGTKFEDIQRERDEILSVDVNKIRDLAQLVKAIVDENNFCVIGSESKIDEAKDLFNEVKTLIK